MLGAKQVALETGMVADAEIPPDAVWIFEDGLFVSPLVGPAGGA